MNKLQRLIVVCLFVSCTEIVAAEPKEENWPSFRGPDASGVRDNSNLPLRWDMQSGSNIRWKTPVPGFGHSSPIAWGGQLFVTSAISSAGNSDVEVGLFGSGDASTDRSKQSWIIAC